MACSSTKTIDEIDDLYEMVKIMEALDISSKGFKTLDELKTQVITTLNQSQTKPNWAAGQVRIRLNFYGFTLIKCYFLNLIFPLQAFSILSEVRDHDMRKKKMLSGLYAECEECLTEMDAKIRSLLKRQIGNLDELIRKHQIDMKRKEYVLLVAGK